MEIEDSNERVFVYCKSNYAFYLGLYLVRCRKDVEFIVFDTRNNNLMQGMELKYTVIDKAKLSAVGMIRHPFHAIRQLRLLKSIIGNDKMVFCHYQFELFLFLFIGLFRKSGRFDYCFIEPEVFSTGWKLAIFQRNLVSNIAEIVWFFVLKALLLPVKLLVFNDQIFIKLKVNSRMVEFILEDFSFQDIVTQSVLFRPVDSGIILNLYIGQNECIEGMYPQAQIAELRELLSGYEFSIKKHPGGYPELFSENVVDFGGPSEFLLPGVRRSLVAVSSTTLISASHVYAELGYGPTIISLIRILTPKDKSIHTQLMERLVSEMNVSFPIHFPASFAELKHLLNVANAE